MSDIVALGERRRIDGFAVAGVRLVAAEDAAAAQHAWLGLEEDVAVLILTPAASAALSDLLPTRPDLIWTTIPD